MIRLPDIPGLQGAAINAPGVSARAAAAPAIALGTMASAIGGVSEQFHKVAVAAQAKENARLESEKIRDLAAGEAALQLELRNETDPQAIIEKTRLFYQNAKGGMDSQDLPPVVRDRLQAHLDSAATRGVINAGAGAAKLQDRRTLLAFQNEIDQHVQAGNETGAMGAIARIGETGLLLPEETAKLQGEVGTRIKLRNAQVAMESDAGGWIEANPRDHVPAGVDPLQWNRLHEQAKEKLHGQTLEDVSTLQDAIVSGAITTPEQLESKAGHLRPTVREKLLGQLEERAADGFKEMVASPEYQQRVIGRVSGMLRGYNPQADGYDEQFVEMDGLIKTLPPGAVRDELTRRIDAVRTGAEAEVKTHAEAAQKALEDRWESMADRLPKPEKMTTRGIVEAGFLKDTAKLESLGFSKDDAADIRAAAEESNSVGQAKLKELWGKRNAGSAYADEIVVQAADALRLDNPTIDVNTAASELAAEAARREHERQLGEAKTKLSDWLKVNPKATAAEIEQKVIKIGGAEAGKAMQRVKLPDARLQSLLPGGLKPLASSFQAAGDLHGIDPRFLAAVAMHETARGTSKAFVNKNNAMGVSNSKGPIAFDKAELSISKMARVLASDSGPYRRAQTIDDIAKVYAPVGAENDPGGLNSSWAAGVKRYFKQLGGDPSKPIL